MRPSGYVKVAVAIFVSMGLALTTTESANVALEAALAGAIGAMVGGVVAALAFLFAIIAKLASVADSNADLSPRYERLITSLKTDVQVLVGSLGASVVLPYLRRTDIPLIAYPKQISALLSKDQLTTGLEIFIVVVSVSVLLDVCESMFDALRADVDIGQKK